MFRALKLLSILYEISSAGGVYHLKSQMPNK